MADGTITKRVNRDGSISWQARLDCGKLPNGKRDRWIRNFDTRREAVAALQAKREEVTAGQHRPRTEFTFAGYVPVWLAGKRGSVADSTYEDYEWWLNKHILPDLGEINLHELATVRIERWRDGLALGGLSARSVNYALGLVKQICRRAHLVDKLLRDDPAEPVTLLRERKKVKRTWQMAEVQRFVDGIAGDRLYPVWLLAITTGMRRGELAGLRWDHVDLRAGTVRVQEARTLVGGKPKPGETKSDAGVRTVSIDPVTRSALLDIAVQQSAMREVEGWQNLGYVFTTRKGTPFHPDYLTHYFAKLCERMGMPHVTLHSLRSTAIALALATVGGNIKLVSNRVGHSRTDVTMDVYAYAFTDQDQAVAAGVAQLLFGSRHLDVTSEESTA